MIARFARELDTNFFLIAQKSRDWSFVVFVKHMLSYSGDCLLAPSVDLDF